MKRLPDHNFIEYTRGQQLSKGTDFRRGQSIGKHCCLCLVSNIFYEVIDHFQRWCLCLQERVRHSQNIEEQLHDSMHDSSRAIEVFASKRYFVKNIKYVPLSVKYAAEWNAFSSFLSDY